MPWQAGADPKGDGTPCAALGLKRGETLAGSGRHARAALRAALRTLGTIRGPRAGGAVKGMLWHGIRRPRAKAGLPRSRARMPGVLACAGFGTLGPRPQGFGSGLWDPRAKPDPALAAPALDPSPKGDCNANGPAQRIRWAANSRDPEPMRNCADRACRRQQGHGLGVSGTQSAVAKLKDARHFTLAADAAGQALPSCARAVQLVLLGKSASANGIAAIRSQLRQGRSGRPLIWRTRPVRTLVGKPRCSVVDFGRGLKR